jgi:hypothetical protein
MEEMGENALGFGEFKEQYQDSTSQFNYVLPYFVSYFLLGSVMDNLITRKSVSQTQTDHKFSSYSREFLGIFKNYGIRELYRGCLTSLTGVACLTVASIYVKDGILKILHGKLDEEMEDH